jgi:hypothetical protein
MRRFLVSLLISSALAFPAAATETFEEWEDRLIAYIAENTFIEPNDERPIYKFMSGSQMGAIYFGNKKNIDGLEILGLNLGEVVILRKEFDPNKQPEILLHELFHFFIGATGKRQQFACVAAEEALAYELQNKFVAEERGGKGITGGEIYQIAGCMHPK